MRRNDETSEARSGSPGRKPTDDGSWAQIQALGSAHRISGSVIFANGETADLAAPIHSVSCICAGVPHTGRVQVTGSGPHSRVSVLYKGNRLHAEGGAMPTTAVAKELLERLVLYESIAVVVQAGEKRPRLKAHSRAI